jgi:hypothetical protein
MQCPKCNHPVTDECANCAYCGEPIPGRTPVLDESEQLTIEDMVRHTMEEGHDRRKEDRRKGERRKDSGDGAESQSEADPLSLEKTAAMLAKMKDLMENGRFDADVYERMALDAVKDFLSTMADSDQLIFVSYEIIDSKLAPFLNEEMLEKIKTSVMDSIAER